MMTVNSNDLSIDRLIAQCKENPDISIFHSIFCKVHSNKIHTNFSNHFLDLLEKIRVIDELKNISQEYEFKDIVIRSIVDSILIKIRAIFLEKIKLGKNYTIQNCLRSIGKYKYEADRIDDLFSSSQICELDFKELIKKIVDKCIAHLDDLSGLNEYEVSIIENRDILFINDFNKYKIMRIIFSAHCIYQKVVIVDVLEQFPELAQEANLLEKDLAEMQNTILDLDKIIEKAMI